MKPSVLSIPDAVLIESEIHSDDRGSFSESYRHDLIAHALGRRLDVAQVNTSVSSRGVLRGVHFAKVPPGQAKLVSVQSGSIADYVIDLRMGGPTYGQWERVDLFASDGRSVFVPEGCGHAFVALEERTVVSYLVTDVYRPANEFGINPFDPQLSVEWPFARSELIMSQRDRDSMSLQDAESGKYLSTWLECQSRYSEQTVTESKR